METQEPKTEKPMSNRERAELKQEWIAELVAGCQNEGDLFGPEGVFTRLKGAVMERLLEAEMTHHLGHDRGERRKGANSRNGHTAKTVTTDSGPVEIRVPRDRDGSFEPQLVKKRQVRLEGFDEQVLALYGRGMSTRDIQSHLRELYGTDVSHELISKATEGVSDLFKEWQSRPLDAVYPIIYLDALFVPVRDGGQVQKRAFYIALGVGLDGHRDVLGLWVAPTEGAKFWLQVMTELRNRGVEDVLFICADGVTGLDNAVETAFPRAVLQTCIVHLLRAALRFVTWTDRKTIATALRPLYTAPTDAAAEAELDAFEQKYGARFPTVVRTFRNRWQHFVPFLAYPQEIRRMLYTTNAIESLNSQLRKVLRNRGPFPNDDAVFKVLFLALKNAKTRWNPDKSWTRVVAQLDIFFPNRLPA
jgi:putative transposase